MKDKLLESAKIIIKQCGDCTYPLDVNCRFCPSYSNTTGKRCIDTMMNVNYKSLESRKLYWFENYIKENKGNEMENKMEKIIFNNDKVKHPNHYTSVVPNIECIQVTQYFNFNRGNAIKYIWRAGLKENEIEDLQKAIQYLDFEIDRIKGEKK